VLSRYIFIYINFYLKFIRNNNNNNNKNNNRMMVVGCVYLECVCVIIIVL